jgi:2-hydroxycyclohexanecarboxyl-CoA dehydrogenase
VEEIRSLGVAAMPMVCDVTDFDAVQECIAAAVRHFGSLDILVNNAGNAGPTSTFANLKSFWHTGPDDWAKWFGTNLYGVLNCSRGAVPHMVERGYGRIVTVVSDAGRVGEGHMAVYSTAKAAAAGFTRALAKATGRHGITVNNVSLGGIQTPGVVDLIPDEEAIKKALRHYVIRRLGQPSDAANAILFLASDAASWVTGQTYPVNGGYSFTL